MIQFIKAEKDNISTKSRKISKRRKTS